MVIPGTAGKDSLKGTSEDDTITGLGAADTLRGMGGIDHLLGGGGNDVLFYDSSDEINGESGDDTLKVAGAGVSLDLGIATLSSIEVIDLTGTGNNSLSLTSTQLVALSGSNVLRVVGNAGDSVNAGAGWTFADSVTVGGATYFEYVKGSATLQVSTATDNDGIGLKMAPTGPVARLPVPTLLGGGNPWGTSVSAAGDVNGDGFADFIVGSSKEAAYGGESYVIFGSASVTADMSNPSLDGTNGFTITGDDFNNERSGFSVGGAGDFNGDGLADLLVGAPAVDRTYVVFGNATSPASVATADLVALTGSGGEYAGRSASNAGDVNGDGLADFIIGAPFSSAGAAYVVFGKSGVWSDVDLTAMSATQGVQLTGVAAGDQAGFSVKGAGDINGDGFGDLIIGAPHAEPAGGYQAGTTYVVFGKKNWADVALSALNPDTTGFKILGSQADDRAGWSVSGAGDVNGDGFDDFLVGAPANRYDYANPVTSPGAAYLIFGKETGWTDLDLGALNPLDGIKLSGALDNDYAGLSVSAAGDVNADGYDDFIVGAFGDLGGVHGASYVVFGKAAGWSDITLSSLTGSDGLLLSPDNEATYSGITVSAAGDVNGDGFDDLVTAASDPTPHDQDSTAGTLFLTAVGGALFEGGDFRGDINLPGTDGNDTLTGGAGVDRIVGGLGADRLDGKGGADVMYGGRGADTFVYRGAQDLRIDGGGGSDRFDFGSGGLTLDLRAIADSRLQNIESMDMRGGGADTLVVSKGELLNLSETTNKLTVRGSSGDHVDIVGTTWSGPVDKTVGEVLYHQYTNGLATLLVEDGVLVI